MTVLESLRKELKEGKTSWARRSQEVMNKLREEEKNEGRRVSASEISRSSSR